MTCHENCKDIFQNVAILIHNPHFWALSKLPFPLHAIWAFFFILKKCQNQFGQVVAPIWTISKRLFFSRYHTKPPNYRLLGGMQPSNDILENINSDSFAQNWSILVLIGKLPFSVVKSLLQRVKYLETQQEVQFEIVSFSRFDPFLVAILSLFHHQFCSINQKLYCSHT